MRDDDRMLDLPAPEFGSGVIGVCDICGERQAVIVLQKERFQLCVIDFLNKAWLKTDKKPSSPAPLYRSERIGYDTVVSPTGKAPAIVLTPTKTVRHPVILVTPDVYGLTTTLLDAAIRFARAGYEVLLPDLPKTVGLGASLHLSLRSSANFRGGVRIDAKRVVELVNLYTDAMAYLRGREMVDPTKSAVFGVSYGATLALALAARDTRLSAVVLAYPMPVQPADLPRLVTAPILYVAGSADRAAARARAQILAARSGTGAFTVVEPAEVRHGFLSRDLSTYDLPRAEEAWTRILSFLKLQLLPPPPRPPAVPARPAGTAPPPVPPSTRPTSSAASSPTPAPVAPPSAPVPASRAPVAPI